MHPLLHASKEHYHVFESVCIASVFWLSMTKLMPLLQQLGVFDIEVGVFDIPLPATMIVGYGNRQL
jgi:hypothetical protein